MRVLRSFPIVDDILDSHSSTIGADLAGYRNHVYRVLNYYSALASSGEISESVQIACAFHDIGIWTDRTFDYLDPSVSRCACYLGATERAHLQPEITAVIRQHHKLTACEREFSPSAEPFRKADLVDVSVGIVRFGVSGDFIRKVRASFPDAGFHWNLVRLAARQLLSTPTRPLPMLRW